MKFKLTPLVKKPWRNFNEFARLNSRCRTCSGTGMAYRFEDRDPIEGYKMADKRQCLTCQRGVISAEVLESQYAEAMRRHTILAKDIEDRRRLEKVVLEKFKRSELTKSDVGILFSMLSK